jgi:predicted O-methyltransferase YrrM
MTLDDLVSNALQEADFQDFQRVFEARAVRTWSSIRERALLFGLAKSTGGAGIIVEIGAFCGGSAAFFAKGLASSARAPTGKVVCVDPLLGAPPWLPLPPDLFTLQELQDNLRHFGLLDLIDMRIGDSAAVGAIWPAVPIDILLIDGDHSFEGALRDIESWLPKMRTGGFLIFDDIDNIPEMTRLDGMLRTMSSVARVGSIEGSGVYTIRNSGWAFLAEFQAVLAAMDLHRPWSYEPVHQNPPNRNYRRTRLWAEPLLDIGYDLAFLGIQDSGDHGAAADSPPALINLAQSVFQDRGRGNFHLLHEFGSHAGQFRAFFAPPGKAAAAAPLLRSGGIVIAWDEPPLSPAAIAGIAQDMRAAGLDGVGYSGGVDKPVFWGVAGIDQLTPLALIRGHMSVRKT